LVLHETVKNSLGKPFDRLPNLTNYLIPHSTTVAIIDNLDGDDKQTLAVCTTKSSSDRSVVD
jgi:hypothetical protein